MNKEFFDKLLSLVIHNYCILHAGECGIPLNFESVIETEIESLAQDIEGYEEFHLALNQQLQKWKAQTS